MFFQRPSSVCWGFFRWSTMACWIAGPSFRYTTSPAISLARGGLFGAQIVGCFFVGLGWGCDLGECHVCLALAFGVSSRLGWEGRFFGLRDLEAGSQVMLRRLVGAILLLGVYRTHSPLNECMQIYQFVKIAIKRLRIITTS